MDLALRHHHHADGHIGLFGAMVFDHRIEIHMIDMVAGQDQNLVGWIGVDKVDVAPYCIGCSLIPVGVPGTGAAAAESLPPGCDR